MRFRSRIAALSALLVLSALLGVVASARAAVPTAPGGNGQAVAQYQYAAGPLDSTG